MLILAPLVGWLMARYGGFLLPRAGDELVGIWRDVTFSCPHTSSRASASMRAARSSAATSGVLLGSPRNAALQIWLELGLVGVAFACRAIAFATSAVERIDDKARPAALAVCASAGVMMFAGPAAWQNWWMTAIGLTAITLAFLSRARRHAAGAEVGAAARRSMAASSVASRLGEAEAHHRRSRRPRA